MSPVEGKAGEEKIQDTGVSDTVTLVQASTGTPSTREEDTSASPHPQDTDEADSPAGAQNTQCGSEAVEPPHTSDAAPLNTAAESEETASTCCKETAEPSGGSPCRNENGEDTVQTELAQAASDIVQATEPIAPPEPGSPGEPAEPPEEACEAMSSTPAAPSADTEDTPSGIAEAASEEKPCEPKRASEGQVASSGSADTVTVEASGSAEKDTPSGATEGTSEKKPCEPEKASEEQVASSGSADTVTVEASGSAEKDTTSGAAESTLEEKPCEPEKASEEQVASSGSADTVTVEASGSAEKETPSGAAQGTSEEKPCEPEKSSEEQVASPGTSTADAVTIEASGSAEKGTSEEKPCEPEKASEEQVASPGTSNADTVTGEASGSAEKDTPSGTAEATSEEKPCEPKKASEEHLASSGTSPADTVTVEASGSTEEATSKQKSSEPENSSSKDVPVGDVAAKPDSVTAPDSSQQPVAASGTSTVEATVEVSSSTDKVSGIPVATQPESGTVASAPATADVSKDTGSTEQAAAAPAVTPEAMPQNMRHSAPAIIQVEDVETESESEDEDLYNRANAARGLRRSEGPKIDPWPLVFAWAAGSINHRMAIGGEKGIADKIRALLPPTGLKAKELTPAHLSDGKILCALIMALRPDLVSKAIPNVLGRLAQTIKACDKIGVHKTDLFTPPDLMQEPQNVIPVLRCLVGLGLIVRGWKHWRGPKLSRKTLMRS